MADVRDQPYERIDTSRRYVLGEVSEGDWEGFGIWDRLAGNRLVERFPPTEEGIDLALERFNELNRKDRRERWNLGRVARICTVAGAMIWLVTGTLATALLSFGFGVEGRSLALVLYGLDAFGYRLAIGSLVVVGMALLLRWMQPTDTEGPFPAASLQRTSASRGLDLVLRVVIVGGLMVWTVSSLGTEALFRLEFDPSGRPPRQAAVVAQLVSTMAFRTWVAGFVLLILRRLPLRRRAPTSSQQDDG